MANYFQITEIDWDTDGLDPQELNLPTEVPIDRDKYHDINGNKLEEDEIADVLSDIYGWCVNSFYVELRYSDTKEKVSKEE